ncbi:hypothetical protein AVEN_81496-1 [Araneus ventricosus]|uniref:Uncharacterized protein n=1 Tax=Araneus ventricosus TaxID=182803 RepID=A0A4Y2E112_ARAVE|nr:hypothetical protein AVEN_81496-1 [Araneus ventricosus]
MGLDARKLVVSTSLSTSQKEIRCLWIEEQHIWTHEDWDHDLFTNMPKIGTQSDSRRIRVPLATTNIRKIDHFSGNGFLVRRAIMFGRP